MMVNYSMYIQERLCIVLMLVSPVVPVPLKSAEMPAVKKKHRRAKSGTRNHDADAGNSHPAH